MKLLGFFIKNGICQITPNRKNEKAVCVFRRESRDLCIISCSVFANRAALMQSSKGFPR